MGIYLEEQTLAFVQAGLVGVLLSVLYDGFRITRIAVPTPRAAVFVEDLAFCLVCAGTTFFFLLGAADGKVRFFLLVGEGIGAVLYNLTLGQVVMRVSKTIIRIVKAIFRFIYRWIFYPIWRLVYNIVALILRPFVLLGKLLKKIGRKAKFSLKVRRRLLYNHCKGLFQKKRRRKKTKEKRNGAKENQKP